jgi:hypothetical protein
LGSIASKRSIFCPLELVLSILIEPLKISFNLHITKENQTDSYLQSAMFTKVVLAFVTTGSMNGSLQMKQAKGSASSSCSSSAGLLARHHVLPPEPSLVVRVAVDPLVHLPRGGSRDTAGILLKGLTGLLELSLADGTRIAVLSRAWRLRGCPWTGSSWATRTACQRLRTAAPSWSARSQLARAPPPLPPLPTDPASATGHFCYSRWFLTKLHTGTDPPPAPSSPLPPRPLNTGADPPPRSAVCGDEPSP